MLHSGLSMLTHGATWRPAYPLGLKAAASSPRDSVYFLNHSEEKRGMSLEVPLSPTINFHLIWFYVGLRFCPTALTRRG